ncbi:hypothetical protein LOTGIDRAFT_159788 [Lottia gigantea]|uniref:Apple domain-containing protein n=1 Tax=Lottia gigantea TaxID=225164 RepID=V4C5Y8_LOTGI|nr:hypothetical protein LOTGIDRAFT_159788 [Lottia gigantea]ESO97034.1 hypothetical protein LOTGIDRAFT_159788 [Lottia gigantea]
MCIANLMLVVVVLWTGSLTLASPRRQPNIMKKFWGKPVCKKYDLIENAEWIQRDSCEENKRFKCRKGYQLLVQTSCKKGEWCLEPSCQRNVPTEYKYKFKYSNETTLGTRPFKTIILSVQENCDEKCKNDSNCTAGYLEGRRRCEFYPEPIIFVSLDSFRDECINWCTERIECVTLSHDRSGDGYCYLFNVTLDQIPENMKNPYEMVDTLAEKVCE